MTGHENRKGVLILRTWYEEQSTPAVRARLLVANGPHDAPSVYATAAGLDDICECVRRWLRDWSKDTSEPEGGHGY